MEAVWAAVAVVVSTSGSLFATVYHSGASSTQISSIQAKQAETDAHVAKHDDQLNSIQQLQAAQGQQLKDIAETVHDMHDNGVKRK